MKKPLVVLTAFLIITLIFETLFIFQNKWFSQNIVKELPIPRPLMSYTFDNLKKINFPKNQIKLGEVVSINDEFTSRIFYFYVPERPNSKNMLKVSGLANIPNTEGQHPIIVMFRGFIPEDSYKEGAGTQPSANVMARNGFMTLAPDFLGFGKSDASAPSFEGRFQTYTTALTLLSSLSTLNEALKDQYQGTISADMDKVGIWGHSNGGHIALSTLAISGVNYPTVLWAPVSKSFPYSILYYTDEYDDQGKTLRKGLSNFETLYDTELFSPTNYYKWIKAPVEINQGLDDIEVPYWWSDDLTKTLKNNRLDIVYFTYPNSDHNLLPDGWNQAVSNTIDFYNDYFN